MTAVTLLCVCAVAAGRNLPRGYTQGYGLAIERAGDIALIIGVLVSVSLLGLQCGPGASGQKSDPAASLTGPDTFVALLVFALVLLLIPAIAGAIHEVGGWGTGGNRFLCRSHHSGEWCGEHGARPSWRAICFAAPGALNPTL